MGLLTYEEVATQMQCSVRTVKRHVAKKNLKAVVLGHKTRRFREADVMRCIAALSGEKPSAW